MTKLPFRATIVTEDDEYEVIVGPRSITRVSVYEDDIREGPWGDEEYEAEWLTEAEHLGLLGDAAS